MGGHRSKSDILVRYKERSAELVSRHMNNIAQHLSELLLEDPPFDVPSEHKKDVDKFRGDLSSDLWETTPLRNTRLREMYEDISYSALILLDGPYDDAGKGDVELLTRWSAYAQRVQDYGFDIGERIIILDETLDELLDPTLTLGYAVDQLIRKHGIIGSMYSNPPMFTNLWKGSYIIWSVTTAAIDVTDNLPEMRYSGGN